MVGFRSLTRLVTVAVVAALVAVALALGASPALASGPGTVPALSSTTHPNPNLWYPSANPAFVWSAAQESGGTVAGYSFALDRNPNTVPVVSGGSQPLSFSAATPYTVGSGPAEDRVADLSGNGIQDIMVENASSNTVSVLMGNGDGTFKPAVSYATGSNPWSMDIGDLTGNGKLDIVTCNQAANTVSVLMSNGDGTFQPAIDYSTGANSAPECVRLGDVNGDGKLDIITANAGTNAISVLLNQGNGTFGAPTTFSTATHPTSIAVGDLNGDGRLDIVTANYATNNVSVLLGNGDGTFQTAVNYSCGSEPETVAVADLNGDGHLDIVTANYTNTASVLLNKGNGTFATNVDYATGSGPYSLAVADLNHDGIPDIVTVNHAANSVSVLLGNGDGTFATHVDYSTGNGPFWVALGDFTGTGYGDIAVTNETDGTVSVLRGSEYFRPASSKLAASFAGKADGTWYFHVRAVDSSGVGGPTATCQVNIDTIAPVTTGSGLSANATSGWTNAPKVTLSATDASSGVAATYYTVDGGTRQTYAAPFGIATAGSHTVAYWSTDNAGNVENAHTGYVNIDTTAPQTSAIGLQSANNTGWSASAVPVTFSATDSQSGLAATYYTIDGGAVQLYGGVAIPIGGSSGSHTVTYWSTDNAGNVENAHVAYVNIDTTAPVTNATGLQSTNNTGWIKTRPVTVTLSASDAQSGMLGGSAATYYRLGSSGSFSTYSGPLTISGDGSHEVDYYSVDALGNPEATNVGYVNIDTTAPTVTDDARGGWSNAAVVVTLKPLDSGSGIAKTQYKLDSDSTWSDTSNDTFTVPAPKDGTNDGVHTYDYRAIDNAGNESDGRLHGEHRHHGASDQRHRPADRRPLRLDQHLPAGQPDCHRHRLGHGGRQRRHLLPARLKRLLQHLLRALDDLRRRLPRGRLLLGRRPGQP